MVKTERLSRWIFSEPTWMPHAQGCGDSLIEFLATRNTTNFYCAITQAAVTDYFRTEDSSIGALITYKQYADRIHSVAAKLINQGDVHSSGYYLITTELANRYQL
ncbi:uncharacterized protein DUF1488 [Nitrosomonas nitrosa]|uniref:DUF1488 domain-containing protein n=1 Tax=Nitrosomonas nitrosa TaxID=52442 RepID=A0A1I4SHD9_9PROT|nr:DUF1488 family protein [Nitrosomonas nitrosa]PTQ89462.1 uncharacterized protein DUF1488 [Nitrosomonas nitrosa]SFM63751.1 Protein of unknown function [Nitrosomonas nitrosa]